MATMGISEPFIEASQWSPLVSGDVLLPNYCSNTTVNGKLWILWRETYEFEVLRMETQMITNWLRLGQEFALVTFVYAKCTQIDCRELWPSLEVFKNLASPWILAGVLMWYVMIENILELTPDLFLPWRSSMGVSIVADSWICRPWGNVYLGAMIVLVSLAVGHDWTEY